MHVIHYYFRTIGQPCFNVHVVKCIQHEYYSIPDNLKIVVMPCDDQAELQIAQ